MMVTRAYVKEQVIAEARHQLVEIAKTKLNMEHALTLLVCNKYNSEVKKMNDGDICCSINVPIKEGYHDINFNIFLDKETHKNKYPR